MNNGEYGTLFIFGTGYNMASYSALKITFTKPDSSTLAVTSPAVTLGVVDLVTSIGTFPANTYVKYTFANGDVNQSGAWSARVTYDDVTPKHLISAVGTFTINP